MRAVAKSNESIVNDVHGHDDWYEQVDWVKMSSKCDCYNRRAESYHSFAGIGQEHDSNNDQNNVIGLDLHKE